MALTPSHTGPRQRRRGLARVIALGACFFIALFPPIYLGLVNGSLPGALLYVFGGSTVIVATVWALWLTRPTVHAEDAS